MTEHVPWPKGFKCILHGKEHPKSFFAYEGCLPDGSGVVFPACGEVAQGRFAEFEHLGFFDLGKSHPWTDSFGNLEERVL